jgi:hypothetical protein
MTIHKLDKAECLRALLVCRRNVTCIVKNEKLKKGQQCGKHSGDAAVLEWQDRKQALSFNSGVLHPVACITRITINTI